MSSRKLRVGFLYNHEELHQVAHTAPIISRLQRMSPSIQVDVLTSSEAQSAAVSRQLDPRVTQPQFHALKSHRMFDAAEKLSGRAVPLGRVGYLAANLDLLRSYDALIVPETTSTLLKTRFGLKDTRLIFYPHGAGDRSISVSPDMRQFDFMLLPGAKTRERMLACGVIEPANLAVVGYPKFDSRLADRNKPLFPNDRPTVLYNPHFDPRLSSWYKFGQPLLDYFAAQDRFNLIVAPHVMLFRRKILASVEHRKIRIMRDIPGRYHDLDHIHFDEGSLSSVDMTYTRAADIYVGDVSSQVYEFIERPRPAIFLNSATADWQGDPNFAFWNCGPVIDDFRDFGGALRMAVPLTAGFAARQSLAFRQTFETDPAHCASERAAAAILDYLKREFGGAGMDA